MCAQPPVFARAKMVNHSQVLELIKAISHQSASTAQNRPLQEGRPSDEWKNEFENGSLRYLAGMSVIKVMRSLTDTLRHEC